MSSPEGYISACPDIPPPIDLTYLGATAADAAGATTTSDVSAAAATSSC
jgi:hypothetical protein